MATFNKNNSDNDQFTIKICDVTQVLNNCEMLNKNELDKGFQEEEDNKDVTTTVSFCSDEVDEDYPNNFNSHEAFLMWFDENIEGIDDIEKRGDHFLDVIHTWCNNNNHEYRDDGVYNMNIPADDDK